MRPAARLLLALPVALALGCSDSPTGPSGSVLLANQSRVLSGDQGSRRLFTFEVPAGTGNLRVQLREGTGDADLVLRFAAAPETGLYDCVSESPESVEECLIDSPQAGTWYVLVVGHEAYNSVRLIPSLGAESGAVALQSGVAVTNLVGAAGSFKMFSIQVPAGAAALDVAINGPNGDADLYVSQGVFPLLNQYDCASFETASSESCQVATPAAGTWYVRVEGFTTYSALTLTATVTSAPPLRTP